MTDDEIDCCGFDADALPCVIYLDTFFDHPIAFVRSEANAIEIIDNLNNTGDCDEDTSDEAENDWGDDL